MKELIPGFPIRNDKWIKYCEVGERLCIFYRTPWRICTFNFEPKYIVDLDECPDKNFYGYGEARWYLLLDGKES